MSNNVQVNEDYKFRISYIAGFFKDIFSTSGVIEDKELDNKIKEIEKQQDNLHIEKLTKGLEENELSKKKRTARASTKNATVSMVRENEKNLENKEVELDEEKER